MRIIKSNVTKKIILIRGLPGSGKSTKAKELAGENPNIFSTDDFFVNSDTGKYEFDPKLLGRNHSLNVKRTEKAMQEGVTPIIVDNTHTRFFEMKKTVELAQKYGYEVEFHEPDTDWAWNVEELAKKNTHGVPLEAIQRMKDRWDKNPTVDDILKSKAPWER
jgi:NEDD4-binding protein 2